MKAVWLLLCIVCVNSAFTTDAACTTHASVNKWDTCSSFAVTNGLHLHSLHKLNPSLDCTKSLPQRLCVADDTVELGPTCGKWDEVQYDHHGNLNDGCTRLAMRNQIADLHYLQWLNPHLDCRNLVAGELVCVQAREQSATRRQCINWDEVIGDGKTDPCAGRPAEMNPHIRCGKPLPKGFSVMACSDYVEVPMMQATCARYQTFTADGKTNYCLLKGGKAKLPELVKHLQLNDNLYCSTHGTVGAKVLVCMEGYVQTVEEDVDAPGSPTRDHLMLKLFDKLRTSPRLPPLDLDGGQDPFQGGARGATSTHGFMHATKKLPPGFSSTASGLVHLAGAAIRAYKAHGNQIMAQSAWGALVRALALQDFSPDLFALQKSDAEFDRYIQGLLLVIQREDTCETLTPAARKQPLLSATARCMCNKQQHILRCQTLFNIALVAIQKDKPMPNINPTATVTTDSSHRQAVMASNPFTQHAARAAAKAPAPKSSKSGSSSVARTNITISSRHPSVPAESGLMLESLTPEEREVAEKIAHALEMAAARAAGADPDAGVMTAEELEKWHDSFKTPEQMRNLLQDNTGTKTVVNENVLTGVKIILEAKNEACKKLQDLIKEGVDALKKAVATCIVKYEGDICDDDGGCLSIKCPAADFQIVSINIQITICIAFPRDEWMMCRAGCFEMQRGYTAIGVPKKLGCPEACVRYLNDGYLNSKAELKVDLCLGGSALNLLKWLDEAVPDWVERRLGINWEEILCFTLIKGGLNFPTGLVYLTVLPLSLFGGLIKTSLDFTLQAYRPWNYPEICDCNASPWACQPYCLKSPGGLTFSGYIQVGLKVNLLLFKLNLRKKWSWSVDEPSCACSHLPPKAEKLCPKGQGIAPPSTTCAKCPAGMIAPTGGTCLACPAGSIPNNDGTNCLYCAKDYIAPNDGSTACVKCSDGLTAYPEDGRGRICQGKCPPGSQVQVTSCVRCPSGMYNPGITAGSCKPCPKGSVPNAARSACVLCDRGLAATSDGLGTCSKCPSGHVPANCQCKAYPYLDTASMQTVTESALTVLKSSTAAGVAAAGAKSAGGFFSPFKIKWFVVNLVKDLLNNKTQQVPTGNNFVPLSPDASSLTVEKLMCAKDYGCKQCNACPPGSFADPGDLTCTPCSPGYYQPKPGQSFCIPCPAGTAAPTDGAASCTTCKAGTISGGCRPKFVFETLPDLIRLTTGQAFAGTGGRRLLQVESSEQRQAGSYMVVPDSSSGQPMTISAASARKLQQIGKVTFALNTKIDFSKFVFAIKNVQPTLQGCTECAPCLPGTYSTKEKSTACLSCDIGTYQDREGATACRLCPQGTMAAYPATLECYPCDKGNMTACGASKVCNNKGEGHATCMKCFKLPFLGFPGQCRAPCPAGWIRRDAGSACQPCAPGYMSMLNGGQEATSCTVCPVGSFTPNYGVSPCQPCPKNTYGPLPGLAECIRCPPLFKTSRTGATKFSDCKFSPFG